MRLGLERLIDFTSWIFRRKPKQEDSNPTAKEESFPEQATIIEPELNEIHQARPSVDDGKSPISYLFQLAEEEITPERISKAFDDLAKLYRLGDPRENSAAIFYGFKEILAMNPVKLNHQNIKKLINLISRAKKKPRFNLVQEIFLLMSEHQEALDIDKQLIDFFFTNLGEKTKLLEKTKPKFKELSSRVVRSVSDDLKSLNSKTLNLVARKLRYLTDDNAAQKFFQELNYYFDSRLTYNPHAGEQEDPIQADEIHAISYGIQNHTDVVPEELIAKLDRATADPAVKLNHQQALQLVFNLRNHNESKSAQYIFKRFLPVLVQNKKFDQSGLELRQTIGALRAFIQNVKLENFMQFIRNWHQQDPKITEISAVEIAKELKMIEYQVMMRKKGDRRIAAFAKALPDNMIKILNDTYNKKQKANQLEKLVHRILKNNAWNLFGVHREDIHLNRFIDGFECDLYLEVKRGDNVAARINLEVDGEGHNENSAVPDKLRDDYLYDYRGIQTFRLKEFSRAKLVTELKEIAETFSSGLKDQSIARQNISVY